MKSVLMLLGSVAMIAAIGTTISVEGSQVVKDGPVMLNPTTLELSHDSGPDSAFIFLSGAGAYVAAGFSLPPGGPWFLQGIKYYVWNQGWPDSTYQGFSVACWSDLTVVWPTSGVPIYNPNTGGGWITQPVQPEFNLTEHCSGGFMVGIGFLYSYPACDALGCSNTGVGPYDWACQGGTWGSSPYNPCIRAIIDDEYPEAVEPASLGTMRALYR
jgi:hypothetical protein